MRSGWQTKKVSEIARHSLGKMLDKAKNKGELKPYLRNLNVRWFDFDLSDMLEMRFLPEEAAKYTAVKGDVLICEGGYPGRAAIWERDEPIYFQKALHRVRFHEPDRSKWFLYYLRAKDLDGTLKDHFNGAGIQHFTGEALAQFEVPLPPISEQKRIVGLLDEAFDGIATAKANADKNLQNARALFTSRLQSVFTRCGTGWVSKTLGDIAQVRGGKRVPKEYKLLVEPTGFPYLRVTDFNDSGSIDMSDLRYVSADVHREIKNYIISSNDMYISIAGTIGKTGIIPKELDGAHLTENACRLMFNQGISNRFVYYFTTTPNFVEQAGLNTRTAAQPKLALSRLSTIKLGIPSLAMQELLADEFDTLREETQRLERRASASTRQRCAP
jgi:type I restriction enzyme, S subunit